MAKTRQTMSQRFIVFYIDDNYEDASRSYFRKISDKNIKIINMVKLYEKWWAYI